MPKLAVTAQAELPTSSVSTNTFTDGEDREDRLHRRTAQLNSLLASLYGGGFESFTELGGTHQDHILWLASDLAMEIHNLVRGEQ